MCSITAGPVAGPRLVVGMALAIEPMITIGSPRTVELDDGWTVVTRDGSMRRARGTFDGVAR